MGLFPSRVAGMIPGWLHALSLGYLVLGGVCALLIAADVIRYPQKMGIMNAVWPVTALFGTGWILWQYFRYGRAGSGRAAGRSQTHSRSQSQSQPQPQQSIPFPIAVSNGTLHCGSGCTLGDLCAEWLVFTVPGIAVVFGWHSLFGEKMFAVWILDYLFAYAFGIVFQYFSIAPMRGLSVGQGLVAAIKADTLSLTAWQVGMYGFMAFANGPLLGQKLRTDSVEFWFMMQIGMLCGFVTSYPVNWWLIRSGIKEKM
jgi:hypothetical protein